MSALATVPDAVAAINREHRLARECAETAVKHAIRCGELLLAEKAELAHGEFMPWVRANCEFSQSTANNYMKAAKNPNALGDSIRHLFQSGRKQSVWKASADFEETWLETAMRHLDESAALAWRLEQRRTETDGIFRRLDELGADSAEVPPLLKRLGEIVRDNSLELEIATLRIRMTMHLGKAFRAELTLAGAIGAEPAAIADVLGVAAEVTLKSYLTGASQVAA